MADPNDKGPADPTATPDSKLADVLASRWDASKMSALMRKQDSSKAQKLDHSQRTRFEGRLGVDLGDVRIYTGELAEEITKAHNAEALTIGNTGMILMRNSSQWAPGSAAGTSLLAHELTHVAQGQSNAVARKAVSADLAHEDASEAEAEHHEAAVHAEETGAGPPVSGEVRAKAQESKDKKKDQLVEQVLKLFEEELFLDELRLGKIISSV